MALKIFYREIVAQTFANGEKTGILTGGKAVAKTGYLELKLNCYQPFIFIAIMQVYSLTYYPKTLFMHQVLLF